jgi:hypothetical protein
MAAAPTGGQSTSAVLLDVPHAEVVLPTIT